LTPSELQEARRRSGRLGGRPRRPTIEEARQAALDRLIPKALKVLEAHLGEGDQVNAEAWRSALRLFEHAFGRPAEPAEQVDLQTIDVRAMTSAQRETAIARMLEEHPGLAALIPHSPGVGAER
jgi:hypothetical protein